MSDGLAVAFCLALTFGFASWATYNTIVTIILKRKTDAF